MFRGQVPQGNVLDFNSLESPFLGFRVIQTAYWPKFNLESVFIITNIIIMKNLTDFREKKGGNRYEFAPVAVSYLTRKMICFV